MKKLLTILVVAVAGILFVTGCKKKKDVVLATLTTTSVFNITDTTAIGGGNVSEDGGDQITAKGVCWDTATNPTVALTTKTNDGVGKGSYVSNLTKLKAGTTYFIRAYATNSAGTAYGPNLTFTTVAKTLALITTNSISSVSVPNAVGGGTITSDGGMMVTARGICWSTSPAPTIDLATKTSDGTGIGSYVSNITGLSMGTLYHVRAYATNSVGTAYGNEVTFTTPTAVLPTLITSPVGSITTTTAGSGGVVNTDGGTPVTSRGVCWSTSPAPTADLATKTLDGPGTGAFVSAMTNLKPGTVYYARAYATNSVGTAYGAQVTFTTTAVAIGATYGGGKVFYILAPGDVGYSATSQHGLIATPSDLSTTYLWGCAGTVVGAAYTSLSAGASNSALIATTCGTTTAAYACENATTGGFTDWYLPSRDQLNALYNASGTLGGFSSAYYWSSSEAGTANASAQWFGSSGFQSNEDKTSSYKVRPVRSF